MMSTAPFWRLADKLAFVFGTMMIIAYSFMIGRYPHDMIYPFVTGLLLFLIATRYVHYFIEGWHFYCTDFCYFANFSILLYINFFPENEALFRLCYLFS